GWIYIFDSAVAIGNYNGVSRLFDCARQLAQCLFYFLAASIGELDSERMTNGAGLAAAAQVRHGHPVGGTGLDDPGDRGLVCVGGEHDEWDIMQTGGEFIEGGA